MIIDASVFFDLLKIVVNRNDEKIHKLAEAIFNIYADNINSVNSTDIKYCEAYIAICKEIMCSKLNIDKNKIDILNIFKRHLNNTIFKRDSYIKEALKSVIDNKIDAEYIVNVTQRLNNINMWYISKQFITKMYGNLKDSEISYSVENQSKSLNFIKDQLEEFKSQISNVDSIVGSGGPIESINLSNINDIKNAYSTFKERKVNQVIKTGLQGLNQMFGPDNGGITSGESVIFAARTHNYKSGILTKIPQWIVKYNKPYNYPGKIPMILFISLENEGFQNMNKMFKEMYISINNAVPPKDMTDEQIVEEIYQYFNSNDYVVVIERYLPQNFGYSELTALLEKFENAGFKIVATVVDYLSQMKTSSYGTMSKVGTHAALQGLYNSVCNYFKAVGNTLFTAHQLNALASEIASSNVPYPVKRYTERHFSDATGIAREVDTIIYMEIERHENDSWLTMNLGKHRYVDNTPTAHKFIAYKFDPELGIIDDLNGKFTGSRNIYSKDKKDKKAEANDIAAILGSL